MPLEADPVWRAFSQTGVASLRAPLSPGTKSSGEEQLAAFSFDVAIGKTETAHGSTPRTTRWFAQVLRTRGGMTRSNYLTKRVPDEVRRTQELYAGEIEALVKPNESLKAGKKHPAPGGLAGKLDATGRKSSKGISVSCCERPDTWVTLRTGDIGYTSSP